MNALKRFWSEELIRMLQVAYWSLQILRTFHKG
jgi:hypothetical protein